MAKWQTGIKKPCFTSGSQEIAMVKVQPRRTAKTLTSIELLTGTWARQSDYFSTQPHSHNHRSLLINWNYHVASKEAASPRADPAGNLTYLAGKLTPEQRVTSQASSTDSWYVVVVVEEVFTS